MIEIKDFRVDARHYQRLMWRSWLATWWPAVALPLLACAALALWRADVRWAVAGLMVTFMLLPMLLALVHFAYALTPEARWSIMEKNAVLDATGVVLRFADSRMRTHTIPWADVARVTRDGKAFYLHLRSRRHSFLIIPRQALAEQAIDEQQLIATFRKHLTANG